MPVLAADIPVIETARLILREPRLSDLDAMCAFGASDRARFVGGPMADWQVWGSLTGMIGHWALRGYGWWVLQDKSSGATAGRLGIGNHIDWPEPELGWHIYEGFEGQGLAYEGALAARQWWRAQGNPPPISLIDPKNTRSRQLAERLGATIESQTTIRGHHADIWRHPEAHA